MKRPNGSFAPVVEDHYRGLCDKGPLHKQWIEAKDFRFFVESSSHKTGCYVFQFGIWIWQGGCQPMPDPDDKS